MRKLVTAFQEKGYNVKKLPFRFMSYALGEEMKKNNMRLDFLKSPAYNQCDVIIGNILSKAIIVPVSLDLVKDCFSKTK
jgi:hypothetical protein